MFKPDFSWIYYVEITFNLSFRLFFKLKDVARPVPQVFNYLPGALVFFDILMIVNDADPTLLSFLWASLQQQILPKPYCEPKVVCIYLNFP